MIMKRKSIHITEEVHEKLNSLAIKYGMPKCQLVNDLLDLCIKERINPKKPVTNQQIKDLYISFIRTQEKTFFIPAHSHNIKMDKEMDFVTHNILAIKSHLRELEYKIDHFPK